MELKNKKVALCLGGGAVLGAFHIGVIKAIEEFDIEISYVSGTSIGSIIGVLYACGKSSKEIEDIALDIKWKDLYTISLSKMGVLSNEKIGDFLSEHLEERKFEDLAKQFGVIAADIATGEKVSLTQGDVKSAVMASSCIPGIFIPVEIEERLLVDGGVIENVPISIAKDFDAEFIIAVDLNTNHKFSKPKNLVEVMINSFNFLATNSTKIQLEEAHLSLNPDLSKYNAISTSQIKDLIDEGYQYTKSKFEKEFS